MLGLKNFRKSIGLSQDRMAEWLGVSRSLVKMVESNQREMPSEMFMKWIAISQIFAESQKLINEQFTPDLRVLKREKRLDRQLKIGMQHKVFLEYKKKLLLEKMESWLRALRFCDTLLERNTVLREDSHLKEAVLRFRDQVWIKYLEKGPEELDFLEFELKQTHERLAFIQNKISLSKI